MYLGQSVAQFKGIFRHASLNTEAADINIWNLSARDRCVENISVGNVVNIYKLDHSEMLSLFRL